MTSSKELTTWIVFTPEETIGAVCGELSNRGGMIIAMQNEEGTYEVRANMPPGSMGDFEDWLAKTTSNRGSTKQPN